MEDTGVAVDALSDDVTPAQAFSLAGRVAVLTGAASGIGKATALVFAGAGATVVLGDIDGPGVETTAKEIAGRGGTAIAVEMDVAKRADVDNLVARAVADHGRIDVMGNIAGVRSDGPVVDVTDEEFDRVFDINLRGVFYGSQAAMRAMIRQGSGHIVNISSGAIDSPAPTMSTYAMTKAAVAQLTKALAAEGAAHGIRANALAPGVILSNFYACPLRRRIRRGRCRPVSGLRGLGHEHGAPGPGRNAHRHRLCHPLSRLRCGQLRYRPDHPAQRGRRDAVVGPDGRRSARPYSPESPG